MVSLQIGLLAITAASSSAGQLFVFATAGCPHCQAMQPTIERLRADGFSVHAIDVEQHPRLARRHRVRAVPSFIVFRDGLEVDRVTGRTGYARLRSMLQPSTASGRAAGFPGQVRFQSPDTSPELHSATTAAAPDSLAVNLREAADTTSDDLAVIRSPSGSPTDVDDPRGQAYRATVRIQVSDAQGMSLGSGTIIDTREGEALVITSGQLFRDSGGEGEILVTLHSDSEPRTIPAKLLQYDDAEVDIGFLVIHPPSPVTPAPVAQSGFRLACRQAVFTVGCANGKLPRVQPTRVSAVNRYLGPANIEVVGAPVDGCSGGGLFNLRGQLTGVCRAADPVEGKGVFVGLSAIHQQLMAIGQSDLAQRQQPARRVSDKSMPAASRATPGTQVARPGPPTTVTGREVLCIMRQPGRFGESKLLIVDDPSPELLRMLAKEARRVTARGSAAAKITTPPPPVAAEFTQQTAAAGR